MKAVIYKTLSDSSVTVEINPGKSIKATFPQTDFDNAIALVNGAQVQPQYKIKQNDLVCIRILPSDSAMEKAGAWVNSLNSGWQIALGFLSVGITTGLGSYASKCELQRQMDELDKIKSVTNSDIDNRPFVSGGENAVATGKLQPYVAGRSMFTPYKLSSPLYKIEGLDGQNQYMYEALELGFNRQILKKISVDDITLKTFTDTEPQQTQGDFDDSVFSDGGRFEIIQGIGGQTTFEELAPLNNRIASSVLNSQVVYQSDIDSTDEDEKKDPLTFTLDQYAKDVEVCISFPQGFFYTTDSGTRGSTKATVTIYYSLDGGKTYLTSDDFKWRYKTLVTAAVPAYTDYSNHLTTVRKNQGATNTSFTDDGETIQLGGFFNQLPNGWFTETYASNGKYKIVWSKSKSSSTVDYYEIYKQTYHAYVPAVYSDEFNSYTFEMMKDDAVRYTASHEFSASDITTLHNNNQKSIIIKVVEDAEKSSRYTNSCYVTYYQSTCYDPNVFKSSGTLTACPVINDRERAYCSMLGIKIKATDSSEKKLTKINVVTQGVARTWESYPSEVDSDGNVTAYAKRWSSAKTATSNPASWLLEVLTSDTHVLSQFSPDELDLDSFGDLYDYCENQKDADGNKIALRFDYVYTTKDTKENVLAKILDVCGAVLYRNIYGLYAVAFDGKKDNAVACFNPQNIISIENKRDFARLTDALRVKFINSENDSYEEDTYIVCRSGITEADLDANSIITDISVTGITTFAHVVWYARRYLAIERLRPKTTTIQIGKDGVFYSPYSKVLLQDDSLKIGLGNGVIKSVTYDASTNLITTLGLSNPVEFTNGKLYGIVVHHAGDSGASVAAVKITGTGTTRVVTVTSDVLNGVIEAGDTYSYGLLDDDGGFTRITTPYLIKSITGSDTGYTLTLVNYNESIYDTGSIPDYTSNITIKNVKTSASKLPENTATVSEIINTIKTITDTNVSAAVTEIETKIDAVKNGDISAGAITLNKLATSVQDKLANANSMDDVIAMIDDAVTQCQSSVVMTANRLQVTVQDLANATAAGIDIQASRVDAFVAGGGATGTMSLSLALPVFITPALRDQMITVINATIDTTKQRYYTADEASAIVNAVYGLVENTTNYAIKGGVTASAAKTLWNLLVSAGLLGSQFEVDADSIIFNSANCFINGKLQADYIDVAKLVADSTFLTSIETAQIILSSGGKIQSSNYVAKTSGFYMDHSGNAQFMSVYIGGDSKFSGEIESGPLLLSNDTTSGTTTTIAAGTDIFNGSTSPISSMPSKNTKVIGTYGSLNFAYFDYAISINSSLTTWTTKIYLYDENKTVVFSDSHDGSSPSYTIANNFVWTSITTGSKTFRLYNLPTGEPSVTGTVWNDNGTLKIKS